MNIVYTTVVESTTCIFTTPASSILTHPSSSYIILFFLNAIDSYSSQRVTNNFLLILHYFLPFSYVSPPPPSLLSRSILLTLAFALACQHKQDDLHTNPLWCRASEYEQKKLFPQSAIFHFINSLPSSYSFHRNFLICANMICMDSATIFLCYHIFVVCVWVCVIEM